MTFKITINIIYNSFEMKNFEGKDIELVLNSIFI